MYELSKNLPLLGSLLAKGVATYAVADPVTGTATAVVASAGMQIVKAFAPDVTEHFVSVLDYARFKEFLIKTHPGDLNHDLDKLIKDALKRAVGFIRRLYLDKINDEQPGSFWQKFRGRFAEIDDVLAAMERDLNARLTDTTFRKDDLATYLAGGNAGCLDELTNYLFVVSGVDEQDADWQKLRTFFREQLPNLFDLSYKEALKDDRNAKAFRAFEIWILEEGLANQRELLAGQKRILAELKALRTNQTPAAETTVRQQLETDVQSIKSLLTTRFDAMVEQWNRMEGKLDFLVDEAKKKAQRPIPRQLTTIPAFGGEFIGREADLEKLRETLRISRKVVLMNGTGGIGKTTLAKWFVNQHLNDFDHVCWIEVTKQDTTVRGKLISGSIREVMADHVLLFDNLNVTYDPKAETTEQRFEKITNALRNLTGRNLFVIDNAGDDAGEKAIRNVLPQPPNWQVLLTSRQRLNGYELLPLDKLDPTAAEEFFRTHYTYGGDVQEVAALLAAIDYHTLTVELFAKTLEAHHGTLSVRDLLDRVQRKALNDPALQRTVETEHHPDETEVYLHLMLAFDCADLTTDEKALLSQLALLPPEPYTVKDHLAPWFGYADPDRQRVLDDTLAQLVKKGWVTQNEHTYALHRLLQQVITYQIPFDWPLTQTLVEAITTLLRTVDNPNALAVYPLRKYGEFLLASIPVISQGQPDVAGLQNNLALVYQDLGRYGEAAGLLKSALKTSETHFVASHSNVIRNQSNLALVYRDLGRYGEAAGLLESALKSDTANFGADHPNVAIRQNNLALVYQDLGRYGEAAGLLKSALKTSETHFVSSHPDVARRQANLAMVYRDLGRYGEAAGLLESALKSDTANFGTDHPNVALDQNNLALVYKDLGRYGEAAGLLESALKSDTANFGTDHPNVAIRQNNLAMVYQNLGRYGEATGLLESALKSDEVNFGTDHPNVARRQNNLAMVYQNLGRYGEATGLLKLALSSAETNFGADHPRVALRQSNLATVYLAVNKVDEAIALLQKAEQTFRLRLGEEHPHTKAVRSWLDYANSKHTDT